MTRVARTTSGARTAGVLGGRTALVALVLAVLAGCVGMPTAGPVVERPDQADATTAPGSYFDPKPPRRGQGPTEIVAGFLEAMQARPVSKTVARQFLSGTAQQKWVPEQEILTYTEASDPMGEGHVQVELGGVNSYDERGAWQGRRSSRTVNFALVTEDGEWRIDAVPNALMVPESWFNDAFERASSYRFDAAAEILVPEPVHVPEEDQFATSLVQGLLPDEDDVPGISRTFLPPQVSLLSVPVDSAGVAAVDLSGEAQPLDEATERRMLVQLVWTLRQESRIRAVRLSVGDVEVGENGGLTPTNNDMGSAYDPNGAQATRDLFGLLDGRLVRGTVDDVAGTGGPFGAADLGLRSFAVNLAGTRVAGVSRDGSALSLAAVEDPDDGPVQVLSGARRLLQPAWDHRDRLWLVDQAAQGARVILVVDSVPTVVQVPQVSGQRVKSLLVSRDGTRLVALVSGFHGDRLVSVRLEHDATGKVLRAVDPVTLVTGAEDGAVIREIAWRTPTTVLALTWLNEEIAEVHTVSVDGAPTPVEDGSVRLLGQVSGLVSSPVEGVPVYAKLPGAVTDLRRPERITVPLPEGLTSLHYVG